MLNPTFIFAESVVGTNTSRHTGALRGHASRLPAAGRESGAAAGAASC